MLFCSALDFRETPLTGCSQGTTCSNNFECKTVGSSQWCCPTVASVCGPIGGRPLDTSIHSRGTVYHVGVEKQGTSPSTRFFYDPASGKCSPFTYLGSSGNYNNFMSRIDCELYCARLQCDRGNPLRIGDVTQSCQSNNDCPSSHECKVDQGVCCPRMRKKKTICTQPLRVGNCDRSVRRYWYSASSRECQSFEFTAEPRCLQGQAYKDNSGKFVTCSTNRAASSCPANYECHYDGSMYGCCPSKAYTCSLAPNQGKTCGPGVSYKFFYNSQTQVSEWAGLYSLNRYYFNIVTKKCSPFAFNGCDGNPNNFATLAQCNNFCMASACAAGDVVYVNPNTQMPIACNDEIRNNCPNNFQCVFDSLTDSSVCCGATDMGVCPDGEK
ncbi:unnamed protein product, partial [Cylicostephanus goldi]